MLWAGAPYRGSGLFMCNEQCLRVRDSRFDVGGAGDLWITAKGHFAISHYPAPPTTSPSLRPHPLYPSQAGVHSARTSSVPPAVSHPQTAQNPLSCLCSCSLLSRKQYHSLAVRLQKKRQPQVAVSSARGRVSPATALAHPNGVATDQARSRRA